MTGGSLLDPLADPRWHRFAAAAPGASIFHHPAWLGLIGHRYRYGVAACCVLDEAGEVRAGIPVALVRSPLTGRRLVAFPFSDVCPPLGDAQARDALLRAADDLRARMGTSLEIRAALPVAVAQSTARFRHHVVALEPDLAAVEKGFRRSSVMRGVRRARREGLSIERRTDAAALDAFFRLHVETRSRLGAPTQPRAFIRDLAGLFGQELGFVLQAVRGGEVAAAAVFLHHGGVLTYKYGASDVRALQLRPNNLLFWEAIRWGCENGMHSLDLGRSELDQQSLREFKLSWGAREHELVYSRLGRDASRAPDGGRLGRVLAEGIRRAPPLASRLAGEALYRHVG